MLQELLLDTNTIFVEKKLLLSLLSTESWLGSEEGSGGQQMTPELSNEVFSAKSTQYIRLDCRKEPYNTSPEMYKRGM